MKKAARSRFFDQSCLFFFDRADGAVGNRFLDRSFVIDRAAFCGSFIAEGEGSGSGSDAEAAGDAKIFVNFGVWHVCLFPFLVDLF